MFYVLIGLRASLRDAGWFKRNNQPEPTLADFLDLVALGTIADVVPLDANNRVLVHQGLVRIRAGNCRPGIRALLQVAGRSADRVQASDLGFSVGPRLNAAGRLEDMSLGIECLLAEDGQTAIAIAGELDKLNRERRNIEDAMRVQAEAMLEACDVSADAPLGWSICLYERDWHQGVIGIVAARIRERYHRPTIAFAPGGSGEIKGSARSIPGLHIRDVLDEVAMRQPGLLSKFGGHAMAAGMTLAEGDFTRFREIFEDVVGSRLCEDDLQAVVASDGALSAGDITLDVARLLADGGPWGQAFPEPLFDGEFDVVQQRIVGERHWKIVLQLPDGDVSYDAIAFNQVSQFPTRLPLRIRAAYCLGVNEFRGSVNVQLRVVYMEAQ